MECPVCRYRIAIDDDVTVSIQNSLYHLQCAKALFSLLEKSMNLCLFSEEQVKAYYNELKIAENLYNNKSLKELLSKTISNIRNFYLKVFNKDL